MTKPPDDCLQCYKGLRNEEPFFGKGFTHMVFSDAKPITEIPGWDGSSVNWDLVNGDALDELFTKEKKDKIQFGAGALRIPRAEIEKVIDRFGSNFLDYELREENGNVYHGHILFLSSMKPRERTTIGGFLANCETCQHIPNNYVQE